MTKREFLINNLRNLILLITENSKKIEQLKTSLYLNKLFDYGYSTKNNSKQDGISHGLGLHYLKKEVEKQHGNIRANCIELQGNYWISFSIDI